MKFRVTLGFTELTVEAGSLSEARTKALDALYEFWPNHVDLITARRGQIRVEAEECQTPP
jgi:hypothetical protein